MCHPRRTFAILALGVLCILAGCTDPDRVPDLRDVRNASEGPEEFGVVPNKPLELPQSFAQLPPPNPNGVNRTSQRPLDDAIVALGGTPAQARATGGVPAGDQALVQQTGRFGRDSQIRTTLASEDLEFRQRRSILSWQLVPNDEYTRAYRPQRLDPFDSVNSLRRSGVRAPAAPPRELAQ